MLINPEKYFAELLLSHGPIRVSELLARDQYESLRPELLAIGLKHKRHRRTRLNESLTLLLESRATIWLQIHEELRWLSKPNEEEITEILETNNLIAPCADNPTATIFIDGSDPKVIHEYARSLNRNMLTIDLIFDGWTYSAAPIEGDSIRNDFIHSRKFFRGGSSDCADQVRMMGSKIKELSPLARLSARSYSD